jgi:hypothetical protein
LAGWARSNILKTPDTNKHVIDVYNTQRNVFNLLNLCYGFSALLGDRDIEERDEEDLSSSLLLKKYASFFEKEATSLLINIAANCRVLDDQLRDTESSIDANSFVNDEEIGTLEIDDAGSQVNTELTLREAFNKIIHATYISHEIIVEEEVVYYIPEVNLTGKLGKKEWTASINILPFCITVFNFLDSVQSQSL